MALNALKLSVPSSEPTSPSWSGTWALRRCSRRRVPLAKGLHRARDWVDSARVHRPRDRAQRGQSVSSPEIVYSLLSRDQDAPIPGEGHAGESVQPPDLGPVVALLQVGGLHHRYERRAA